MNDRRMLKRAVELFMMLSLLCKPFIAKGEQPAAGYAGSLPGDTAAVTCPAITDLSTPLALATAVDLALCNNSQIRASWAIIREQAAAVGEANAAYWPTLTGSASELDERTAYAGVRTPATAQSGNTVYGAFDWRLFDFGGRSANRRAAQAQLEAAIASRDATVQKILGEVVEGYFNAITAQGLLVDKQEDEQAARATLAAAQRRASHGQAGQGDVLQSAAAVAKVALDLNRARSSYEKAIANLVYELGLRADSRVQLPEDIQATTEQEEQDLQAWLAEAELHHPAIMAARAAVTAAQAEVVSARAQDRPTVDVTSNYYLNGFPYQGLSTLNSRIFTFGVQVTVPLFDGFATHYKVQAAQATVQEKEAELEDTEQSTAMQVIGAYADADSALRNLRASKDLIVAADAAFESAQRLYDNGAGDILELLTAQSAKADAEEQRTECVAAWQAAQLMLLTSAGQLDQAALQTDPPR